MNVQILTTPSCSSCKRVEGMLDKMKVPYTVIDVTRRPGVLKKYPIMTAPGIVIDGKLAFSGVPKESDLRKKLGK